MRISGLQEITIGVGHLRRQVDFYASNLGLRIRNRGMIPAETCRRLWLINEHLNVVVLGRQDLPNSLRLRLIPTFDLPARPDFDITRNGPLGILFGTEDILRAYYRLSGAGVEFHSPPVPVGPKGPRAQRHGRSVAFGRAYDGEYVVLAQPAHGPLKDGTLSPYFGVTEPLEIQLVVSNLDLCSEFLRYGLGFDSLLRAHRDGEARERAMGLATGSAFELETLRDGAGQTRISLLRFRSDPFPQPEARPPTRGICALRFDCLDLEQTTADCQEAGGRIVTQPVTIAHPALGEGRATTLMAPFGVLIELWQSV